VSSVTWPEGLRQWSIDDPHDNAASFAAFLAALDGEELLAGRYVAVVSGVTRLILDEGLAWVGDRSDSA
jgi:hypothetical protein